jgi:toxin-antitoxin system PIN domain toxin
VIAVDTNVLLYAHRTETSRHATAAAWLARLAEGRATWAIPAVCISEFLRVATHRRVFDPPSTPDQALAFLDALIESPSVRIARPGEDFYATLSGLTRGANATGNLVFDAQIAAACMENGIDTLLTDDRDFLRFEGLKIKGLDAPPA